MRRRMLYAPAPQASGLRVYRVPADRMELHPGEYYVALAPPERIPANLCFPERIHHHATGIGVSNQRFFERAGDLRAALQACGLEWGPGGLVQDARPA